MVTSYLPLLALVGGIVAFIAYLQRRQTDLRAASWDRMRWAIEQAQSEDARDRVMAGKALRTIADSRMVRKVDSDLYSVMYQRGILGESPVDGADESEVSDT